MNQKHVAIEILPRALWVILGLTLYLSHRLTETAPVMRLEAPAILGGIYFFIGGIVYAVWVFSHIGKAMFDKSLVTDGPYAYARHPMYVAIYMLLIGVGFIYFGGLWFAILAAFVPLWYIDCRIEEHQMIELHGEDYLAYRKRVGMFLPKIIRE